MPFAVQLLNEQAITDSKQSLYNYDLHFEKIPGVSKQFKAGVDPKAVFWLGIMFLMQISRLRFKQSRISMLISHIYVLGCFVNFWVIFRYIWREIVFLKGLIKLMEIGNFEDLLLF